MFFIALDSSTFVQERVGKSWERCKPILINRSTHDFVTDAGRSCFGGPVAERRTERASVAPAPVPGPPLRPRTAIRMGWPFLDRGRCTTIFRSWILCCSLLVSALQSNQCQWIKHYHFLKFLSRFCFTLLSFLRRHRIAVRSKKYRRFKSQRGSRARIFPSSTQKVFSWRHTCLRASTAHAQCSSPRLRRSLSSSLIVCGENARGQRRTQRANQLTKIVIRGFTAIEQVNKYTIDCACD